MAKSSRAPWKRSNPRKRAGKASKHLTPAQKSAAKARARRAGRSYPNLVDNMRMAAKKPSKAKASKKKSAKKTPKRKVTKKAARKKSAKKKTATTSRKRRASPPEKDPRGGLTAAGRKAVARKQGAHLRPGVTKTASEMTPQEMRRKGSWAVRFYGPPKLPPLVGASRFRERWRRRGASPQKVSACWRATAAPRRGEDESLAHRRQLDRAAA